MANDNVPSAAVVAVGTSDAPELQDSLVVKSLSFAYPGFPPVVSEFSLQLPRGSRCLLLGANGAGKTTLLTLLAGKHLVGRDIVRVLGKSAFHDLELTSTGALSYLGPQWRRDISFAGYGIPMQGDIRAGDMLYGVDGVDESRRSMLIELLDIDLDWRLNRVSDGQRRRVQIAMGLLKPYQVLLLDEITVDMDVVGRMDLLAFFKRECEERGATIVYATHIFDGLEPWITHLAYVSDGKLVKGGPVSQVPELGVKGRKLLRTVDGWLRNERDAAKAAANQAGSKDANPEAERRAHASNPFSSAYGRHMAFYR